MSRPTAHLWLQQVGCLLIPDCPPPPPSETSTDEISGYWVTVRNQFLVCDHSRTADPDWSQCGQWFLTWSQRHMSHTHTHKKNRTWRDTDESSHCLTQFRLWSKKGSSAACNIVSTECGLFQVFSCWSDKRIILDSHAVIWETKMLLLIHSLIIMNQSWWISRSGYFSISLLLCLMFRTSRAVTVHQAWRPSAMATRRSRWATRRRWASRSSRWDP